MSRPTLHSVAPLLLVLAGLAAYAGGLSAPFIFDDGHAIAANRDIRQLLPLWLPPEEAQVPMVYGRPLVRLSLALNYALGGLEPFGYHLFNLAVHLLAGLTLYGIARRTLALCRGPAADGLALAGALLWLLHPLHSECIGYVVQRSSSLAGLFLLLALYAAIRAADGNGGWNLLAVSACLLGTGSKELIAVAPLLVLLYDRTFLFADLTDQFRRRWPLYAGMAATGIPLGLLVASAPHGNTVGFARGVSSWDYLLAQCQMVVHYLRLSFWPHPLLLDYGEAHSGLTLLDVAPQALLLIGLLLLTLFALYRRSPFGFPAACFFLLLAPTSSLFPIVTEVGAERRMYLPLAGLIFLLLPVGYHLLRRFDRARAARTSAALALLAAIALGLATHRRALAYLDTVSLWRNAVELRPDNPRAHYNLAVELVARNQVEEGVHHYRQAIEAEPRYARAHNNLAVILEGAGDLESALYHYRQALRYDPENPETLINLGVLLQTHGNLEEAITCLRRAVEIDPHHPDALNDLGVLFQAESKLDSSVHYLERAIAQRPDYADAHFNLGNTHVLRGDYRAAVDAYRRALEIDPDHDRAARNLRIIHRKLSGD